MPIVLNKIREQEEQKIQTPVGNQQLNGVSELTLNFDTCRTFKGNLIYIYNKSLIDEHDRLVHT